jgi:DNA-binding PadR family transcriptional regulator
LKDIIDIAFIMHYSLDELMPFRPADQFLPLTPIAFEILLALLEAPQHGYAILQAVESRTAGTLPLRTGTLYRALASLLDAGLIEDAPGQDDHDTRRKRYALSETGREVLAAETERLESQVRAARARQIATRPKP